MMTTMKKATIATILGATTIFTGALAVNAATITSADQKFTMETPNDNWKEVSDENTKMTLTNGTDYVTVKCFDKEEALKDINTLPIPTIAHDEVQEEFEAYYSTDKDVYVITGLADRTEDIDEVRSIVNSIKLADHKYPEKADNAEERKDNKENNEKKDDVEKTDEMYTLYNEVGKMVTVYGYTDGNYRSEDGTLFQHVDDREWVDYYGNHYTTDGTSANAERTGNTIDLTSESGALVVVYEYTDGSYRSEDGNLFQDVDGNEFVDYSGNHYYKEYMPQDEVENDEQSDEEEQNEECESDEAGQNDEENQNEDQDITNEDC